MRVGIEVGGTFTDLIAIDGDQVLVTKVPSVPARPEEGVFAALAAAAIPLARVTDLVHGSTVATNAVLERKDALAARAVQEVAALRRVVQDTQDDDDSYYNVKEQLRLWENLLMLLARATPDDDNDDEVKETL